MQNENEVRAWFTGRLPDGWFTGPPDVSSDNDEILVRGELSDVELAAGTSDADKAAARQARIGRFREETREGRMKIADEAERQFGRKVAWAAGCGGEDKTFTTLSIPVMTRLRMPERKVLDTVAERVLPSVASIQVRRGGGERGGGSGSAVALTPDGFLVTSAHVVAGAAQGRAAFIDGRELPIDVVGADPLSDLAVVRARAGGPQPLE